MLYVFVVIEHGTRRLAHVNVTAHPSSDWTLQQLREVVGDDGGYRYLIHDRDRIFAKHLDDSACAAAVVDDDLLAEALIEPLAEDARDRVGASARRERRDEPDRARGMGYRKWRKLTKDVNINADAQTGESIMYVVNTKRLTLAGARKMMTTAIGEAETAGIPIAVAIADAGGHLVMLERMDGGRFHTVHSSTTKAVCAASNKRPTTAKGAQAQPLDTTHAIGLALAAGPERWTAMEGGYPVIFDGECVGGIGVSGGDWAFDDRVARAAIEAIGATYRIDAN